MRGVALVYYSDFALVLLFSDWPSVSIVPLHGTAIGWDVLEAITSGSTFRFLVARTNVLKTIRSIVRDTLMVYVD